VHAAQATDRLVTDVTVFDVYEGEGIAPGKKSIAIAVRLQPRERTLTDAETEERRPAACCAGNGEPSTAPDTLGESPAWRRSFRKDLR
jgi:hypothetical protein